VKPSERPRELQVLGRAKPASAVAARDFKAPRRLGPARIAALRLALENLLPALEKKLSEVAGLRLGLALDGFDEVDAGLLLAGLAQPPCVLRFRAPRAPAWLSWESAAAVGFVERVLGAKGAVSARKLSPTEARIAAHFLGELARAVTGALGLGLGEPVLVQAASELGSWRDGGDGAEPHRLEVRLELRTQGDTSLVRLYLPGIDAGASERAGVLPKELPAHLERVEVELCAELAGCQLSLDQLLSLEEGDVIPLEARLGDPTSLCVEGHALARARLGSHRGRLAVRIERIDVQPLTAA
jgi:flagellar motor switch protein FliM